MGHAGGCLSQFTIGLGCMGGGSMQPGLGVRRLLPAGLRQELFIAERDWCGGVARVGVGVAVANEVTEIRQTEG
jgi:hypothetical protein